MDKALGKDDVSATTWTEGKSKACQQLGERTFQAEETANAKALKWVQDWPVWKNGKEVIVAGVTEYEGRQPSLRGIQQFALRGQNKHIVISGYFLFLLKKFFSLSALLFSSSTLFKYLLQLLWLKNLTLCWSGLFNSRDLWVVYAKPWDRLCRDSKEVKWCVCGS